MAKVQDEIEILLRMRAEGLASAAKAAETLRTIGTTADKLTTDLNEVTRAQTEVTKALGGGKGRDAATLKVREYREEVSKATKALNDMTAAEGRARARDSRGRFPAGGAASTSMLGPDTAVLNTAARAWDDFQRAQAGYTSGARHTSEVVNLVSSGVRTLATEAAKAAATYMAFSAVMSGFSQSISIARPFEQGLSQVSTLIEGTAEQMDFLRKQSKAMAAEFGTTSADQIKGFYEILSAGVDDIGLASEIMQTANKLAVGGATDQTTAMDMLTTAVNTYAASNLTAAHAADVLFVGTALGKTNMNELGHSLGGLLPITQMLGVSFEEAVISVSALTTVGISTETAVSGIRQAMVSVLRPTDDAAKVAKALGLEFNAAALKAKGFQGFLADVMEKTGGSSEVLAKLFSDIDGFKAIAALAGGAGEQFAKGMSDVQAAAGKTDEAFGKISKGVDQKLRVQLAKLGQIGEGIGSGLLTVLVPALVAVNGAISALGDALPVVGGALAGLALSAIPAAVSGVVGMVGAMATATAGAGTLGAAVTVLSRTLSLMGGPLGIILAVAGGVAAYVLTAGDGVGAVASNVADLDRITQQASTTTEAIKTDTDKLRRAKEDLNKATRDGADAERLSAQAAVDALTQRIDGNKVLLAQLREAQQVKLDDLRDARREARDEYAGAAAGAFQAMLVSAGKSQEEAGAALERVLAVAKDDEDATTRMAGAVLTFVDKKRELVEAAGQTFDTSNLGPTFSAALASMRERGTAFAEIEGQVKAAEDSVAGLTKGMGASVPAANRASTAMDSVAASIDGLGAGAGDAAKKWDALVNKFGGASVEVSKLEADLTLALGRMRDAAKTPGYEDDMEAMRVVRGLQEAIDKATDAEGRIKALQDQFEATSAAAAAMGFDKNGMMRSNLDLFKRMLEDAKSRVDELNNADLTNLENALNSIGMSAGAIPGALQGALDWVKNQTGVDLSGLASGVAGVVTSTLGKEVAKIKNAQELADKGILELIAKGESGGDYNMTLDNGRWTGGPRNLTSMTLAEVRALQNTMRTPENRRLYSGGGSSALGRYQIVGTTLQGLMDSLKLDPNALYDEKMQDRLAMELVRRRRGQGPSGFKAEWTSLKRYDDSIINRALGASASGSVAGDARLTAEDESVKKQREEAAKAAEDAKKAAADAAKVATDHARQSAAQFVQNKLQHDEAVKWAVEEKRIREEMFAQGRTDGEIEAALKERQHAREQQQYVEKQAWIKEEAALRRQLAADGLTPDKIEERVAARKLEVDAAKAGITVAEAQAQANAGVAVSYEQVAEAQLKSTAMTPAMVRAMGEQVKAMADADAAAKEFVGAFAGGFDSIFDQISRGQLSLTSLRETAGEAFSSMGAALMKFAFQAMVLQPILDRLRASMSGGGGGGLIGNVLGAVTGGAAGGAPSTGVGIGFGGIAAMGALAAGAAFLVSRGRSPDENLVASEEAARASANSTRVIYDRDTAFRQGMAAPAAPSITVAPVINVTTGSAPGAQQQQTARDSESLGNALTQRIRDTVHEFMVENSRPGGMLSPATRPMG